MGTYGLQGSWRRRVVVVLLGVVFALVGLGVADSGALPAGPQGALAYTIHTRYAADHSSTCGVDRTRQATLGVPTPVDVGGSVVPDVVVTLVAAPGQAGGPDVVQLLVQQTGAHFHGLVEAILAPSSSAPGFSVGYDGCEAGVPSLFSSTVTATDTQVSVDASTATTYPILTLLGSTFSGTIANRTNPTTMTARLDPVPATLSAVVDVLGPSSYEAALQTSEPTELRLGYREVDGAAITQAGVTVDQLPEELGITFNPDEVSYVASDLIDALDFSVTSSAPGDRTTVVAAELDDVPLTANLVRTSETAVSFTTPGDAIGTATVSFASFEPSAVVPSLPALPDQFLAADVAPNYATARVRLFELSHAEIDAGSATDANVPIVVQVNHAAGPFHIDAHTVQVDDPPGPPPPETVVRDIEGSVLDLPAVARVTFSPVSQAFSYEGSDEIGSLDFDVTSSRPLFDDARRSHLRILGMPTGLNGRLDALGERFTANLVGGDVDVLEALVTSGPTHGLPDDVDGVFVADHVGSYVAFVRITGLQHAEVAWGATQLADIVHEPGPFRLLVDTDDVDTRDIEVDGRILDLPARARVEYTSSATATSLLYTGSDVIGRLQLDVVSGEPLFDDANEAHILLLGLPPGVETAPGVFTPGLTLTVDKVAKRLDAATTGGALGFLEIELCESGSCAADQPVGGGGGGGVIDLPDPDGVFLTDRVDVFNATARITGLSSAHIEWGDPVVVDVIHTAGPFTISVLEDKTAGEFGQYNYAATTQVNVLDLPADVFLTYSPTSQTVHYEGSDEIARFEARRILGSATDGGETFFPEFVAGRATDAHLLVLDIPRVVDLTFAYGDAGGAITVNVGPPGSSIGRLELELLSDRRLIDHPEIAWTALVCPPTTCGGIPNRDGLQFWDLDNGDTDFHTPARPYEDPYVIVLRATDVQSASYEKVDYFTGSHDDDTAIDHFVTAASLQRTSAVDLYIQVRRNSPGDSVILFGNKAYPNEVFLVRYDDAPAGLGFRLDNLHRHAHDWLEISYTGTSDGGQFTFYTNAGSGSSLLDLTVDRLPAGTPDDPGVWVCIAPNSMRCGHINRPEADTGQLSITVEVNSRIVVNGSQRNTAGDHTTVIENLGIDLGITVSKEENNDGFNSTFLYADTHGGTVDGEVSIYEDAGLPPDGDRDLSFDIPPGFRAEGRLAELEYEGTGYTRGSTFCPAGFKIEHDWGLDLQNRFCTGIELESVDPNVIARPPAGETVTYTVALGGHGFTPETEVLFGDFAGSTFTPDPGITVTGVTFVNLNSLIVEVQVTDTALVGLRDVRVRRASAIDGTRDVCNDCVEVT